MASRHQQDEPEIDIDDEEWNGIEDELSASESSDEDEEGEQSPRDQHQFAQQDPNLLQRKQAALHHSQDTLSMTKQMKQRNVSQNREHGLYHRQHDPDGLLSQRYKPQTTLPGRQKEAQNVDYSEDISLDGRRGKEGRHYSSSSGERSLTPNSPTAPALVVSGEEELERRGQLSPRISPRGQTNKQDPWHSKRGHASTALPSIGGQHARSDSSGLPSIGKGHSNECLPAAGKLSPRNSRPGTPDIAALSRQMQQNSLSRSTEDVRRGPSSPTAPLQSPRLAQRGHPQPPRPKSPKVSLRMNANKGGQLYNRDELHAPTPNAHQRSLSAGAPRR